VVDNVSVDNKTLLMTNFISLRLSQLNLLNVLIGVEYGYVYSLEEYSYVYKYLRLYYVFSKKD
jgi:hypothetical protein